jgi:hypothetical protein
MVTQRLTQIEPIRHTIVQLGRQPAAAATINRPVDQIPDREFLFTANLIVATFVTVMIPSALLGVALSVSRQAAIQRGPRHGSAGTP